MRRGVAIHKPLSETPITLPVHFAPGQFFSCTDCGKCCTSGWVVNVSEEMAEKISETESYRELEREGYLPLQVVNGTSRLGKTIDDVCLYHRKDGCDLHRELGAREKPITCRSYPFQVVQAEEAYFVSLAYSCPAALDGSGDPLFQYKTRLEDFLVVDSGMILRCPQGENGYPLTSEHQMTWTEYLQLEKALFHADPADPVLFLLNASASIVQQTVSLGRLEVEELEFYRPNELLVDAVQTFPIFVTACLSIIERDLDFDKREAFAEAFQNGLNPRSHLLDAPCPNFELLQPDNQVVREILLRYLRNLIAGKRLLLGPNLVSRLLMLSVSVSLLLYYQKFQAELRQTRHFNFEQWEWAFETIELNLVTHNNDLQPYFQQFEKALTAIARVREGVAT